MAMNHMLCFLVSLFLLVIFCRYGFGWTPGDPHPPSYTLFLEDLLPMDKDAIIPS
jgi:hypothetical protein